MWGIRQRIVAGQDYHLQSGSPAIDAGLNALTIDIDGDTRPEGSTVDIRADEFGSVKIYVPIILKNN